jgi:hypothetical protein
VKVNNLHCYSCDAFVDGDDCLNILNQTRTRPLNLTKKCAQEETYCSVKRFSYTTSDKNTTSEKKLWSLQRNCSEKCENSCIIIGERTKLYACQTCCNNNNLCNTGSSSCSLHQKVSPVQCFLPFLVVAFTIFFNCQKHSS